MCFSPSCFWLGCVITATEMKLACTQSQVLLLHFRPRGSQTLLLWPTLQGLLAIAAPWTANASLILMPPECEATPCMMALRETHFFPGISDDSTRLKQPAGSGQHGLTSSLFYSSHPLIMFPGTNYPRKSTQASPPYPVLCHLWDSG